MGAIAGIIASQKEDLRAAAAMADLLVHRGPESCSISWFDGKSLRLQVNPLPTISATPAQLALVQRPALAPTGEPIHVLFDGILHNADELRRMLENQNHPLKGDSHAALAAAAYHAWGLDGLQKLEGPWALALFDQEKHQLLLARDPLGMRPLYYWGHRAKFAFISEIKALFALSEMRPRFERQMMIDFLHHGAPDIQGSSYFSHVSALPPGHYALLNTQEMAPVKPHPYPQSEVAPLHLGEQEAADQLRALLTAQLTSIPAEAGISFPGGLASGALAWLWRHQLGKERLIHSFTAIFPPTQDARTWLTLLGSVAQTLANSVEPRPEDFLAELDHLLWHQEMPFASPACYTEWSIQRSAYEARVPALISGLGADILFDSVLEEPAPQPRRWFRRLTPERALNRLMPDYLASPQNPDSLATLLRQIDRNSGAFAITPHLPFLAAPVARFIRGLAPSQRQHFGQDLITLRQAFTGLIPEPLLNRRGYNRYTAPLDGWMQQAILPAMLRDIKQDKLPLVPLVHGGEWRELVTRQIEKPTPALNPLLFRLFIANRWMQRFHVASLI